MKITFFEGEEGKKLKRNILIGLGVISLIAGFIIYKQKNKTL